MRAAQARAAGSYLAFVLIGLAIWAVSRGFGRIVVPIVLAILVGCVIARWLRAWWSRVQSGPDDRG